MLQRTLLPIFLLVISVFSGVRAQTFTIASDRIEYIDPETHKLITITEKLGDFKSIELSRVDNYFSLFISQKMMPALVKHSIISLNFIHLKFQMSGLVSRKSWAWLVSKTGTTLC